MKTKALVNFWSNIRKYLKGYSKLCFIKTTLRKPRESYTVNSFKHNFKNFIKDYPVILSTTHSIMNSISENYLFDYLIIDEASQVDLVTASLALACCKNVVIVGDVKQLPQIVGNDIEKISDEMYFILATLENFIIIINIAL